MTKEQNIGNYTTQTFNKGLKLARLAKGEGTHYTTKRFNKGLKRPKDKDKPKHNYTTQTFKLMQSFNRFFLSIS